MRGFSVRDADRTNFVAVTFAAVIFAASVALGSDVGAKAGAGRGTVLADPPADPLVDPLAGVEARISAQTHNVHPGKPIVIDFTLRNHSDEPVVLTVPDVTAEAVGSVTGLPLSHVFSGPGFAGLTIRSDYQRTWTDAYGYQPPSSAPDIVLAPHAIVGATMDITAYYPPLRSPGIYRLVWQPYGGLLTSNQLTVDVAPLKQAEILTDHGAMRVQFLYDLAPNHVANFIELARSGFYNQKTFHRIEAGYFIQGGCPNGDGTGIRRDGKKLKAEFSDYPIERGTLCMARLEGDPDSASCQFLIANTRLPAWDGRYTAFGQLVGEESMKTLDNLMSLEVDPETAKPNRALYIRAIRITDASADAYDQVTPEVDTPHHH